MGESCCLWADDFAHHVVAKAHNLLLLFVDMERAGGANPYRVLASADKPNHAIILKRQGCALLCMSSCCLDLLVRPKLIVFLSSPQSSRRAVLKCIRAIREVLNLFINYLFLLFSYYVCPRPVGHFVFLSFNGVGLFSSYSVLPPAAKVSFDCHRLIYIMNTCSSDSRLRSLASKFIRADSDFNPTLRAS